MEERFPLPDAQADAIDDAASDTLIELSSSGHGKDEEDDDRDGKVYVLCKGADNVIMERLSPGQGDLERQTEDHLAEFASEGLRTLTLAYKVVPGAYFTNLRAS